MAEFYAEAETREGTVNVQNRILAILSLIVGVLGCLLLGCLSGIIAIVGVANLMDPSYYWESLDTGTLAVFSALACGSVTVAILLIAASVWAFLSGQGSTTETNA